MFKLNRAAAIETGKVILFAIAVAIVTSLVITFVSFQTIMFGFLIAVLVFLIKMIYDHFANRERHD